MPEFVHEKDKFGNDMWFGNAQVRMPAAGYIHDYDKHLDVVKGMQLRPDDVIVVGYPKSGLNWTHHMVSMLVDGTTDLPCWCKKDAYGHLDAVGWDNQLPPASKPRAIYSHFPFRYLPRDVTDKRLKLVYVTRNPKDVFVSMFCVLKKLTGTMGYQGSWPQFFSVMLEQGYWYGDYFDYIRDWEREIEAHSDTPILPISFEDSKQDTLGQVERLNEFLGTGRSRQFCQEVAHTCRFSNMHVTRKFDDGAQRAVNWDPDLYPSSLFFRKGEVGDWKNWFTVAQDEEFCEVFQRKMAGSKVHFRFEL